MPSGEVLRADRQAFGSVVYDVVVRTHVWVAAAVTSLASFSAHTLEFEPSLAALGVVFLSTLLIYNLDTAIDLTAHDLTAHDLTAFGQGARARQTRALRLTWLSLGALLGLLTTLRWSTSAVVIGGAAACCLYAVPLGPHRWRMKALPGAKSLVVGSAVAIAVVLVPLVEHAIPWTTLTWLTLAFLGSLTTVNATLFDVRDLEQDHARGERTLPLLLGLTRTRLVLGIVVVAAFGTIAAVEPRLRQSAWLVLGALLPLSLWLGPRSAKGAYAWLVDGALFLPWLVSLS